MKPTIKVNRVELPKLPKKLEDMTNDEMLAYGWKVMDKHMVIEGDPVDVRKLPPDYDDIELSYQPATIICPEEDKKYSNRPVGKQTQRKRGGKPQDGTNKKQK